MSENENYQIGLKFYNEEQYDKALKYFLLEADKGFANAQNNLGYMYQNGYGVEKSDMKAVQYYQLAADKGLASAQNNLGIMYKNGYSVEKSYQKAIQYFQLAVDQGCLMAQSNLDYLKSSTQYIQYKLSEQLKMNDLLRQQIEFLEAELKYEPDDNGHQEALCSTKEPIEYLVSDV
jgi:TPR repeat protein